MNVIPDDITDAAEEVFSKIAEFGHPAQSTVAKAIMDERLRCFKLVLECGNYNGRKNLIYRSDALELIQRGVK